MKSRLVPIALACAAVAAAALVTGCAGKNAVDQTAGGDFRFVSASDPGQTWKPADRKHVGEVTGDLLDGGSFTLARDAGKVVVINFWASWCAPCQIETPQFDSVYRAYKDKGVDFVGIDFKDQRGKAQSFVKDNDISFPIVYDQQGKTALQLGHLPSQGLPFTVLIDKQQRVAAVYVGSLTPKDLEPVLDKLIAEPDVATTATASTSAGPGA
jgi:thiol-disulfide isomerase/thioredoxin